MRLCTVTLALLAVAPSPASEPRFPLKIAEGQRFLVDQDGTPFLVVGDVAWSLIVQLHEADIDRYLDDRRSRGFNSIIVNLIEHKFCTNAPKTRAGLTPFKRVGDFSVRSPRILISPTRSSRRPGTEGSRSGWRRGISGSAARMKAGSKTSRPAAGRRSALTADSWVSDSRTCPTSSGWSGATRPRTTTSGR